MSNHQKHISFSILLFIPFAVGLSSLFKFDKLSTLEYISQIILLFCITVMFSLWPDIDTKSKGQKIFYIFFLIVDVTLIYKHKLEEAAYLGIFSMLPIISNHRGFFHSIIAVFLFPVVFLVAPMAYANKYTFSQMLIGLPYYLAAVIGYFSHYLADGILWKNIKKGFKP